jgi:hypothetical protein
VNKQWSLIEDFLQIKIERRYRDILTTHQNKQMQSFYQCHECFDLAWKIYHAIGPSAPVENLAREHFGVN